MRAKSCANLRWDDFETVPLVMQCAPDAFGMSLGVLLGETKKNVGPLRRVEHDHVVANRGEQGRATRNGRDIHLLQRSPLRVDVLWRAIAVRPGEANIAAIPRYFAEPELKSARQLRKKPAVLVSPQADAGQVIWIPPSGTPQ